MQIYFGHFRYLHYFCTYITPECTSMKKLAKITGLLLVCIVAAMAIAPIAFKGKIKEIVISEANKHINAEFGFDGLSINLFKEFPQASVSVKGFWLRGKEAFANDTLARVGDVGVAVNLMSIFGDSGFDITKVWIKDTYLKAIVLDDGRANWDIMYPSQTEQPEEEDTTASNIRILLKKVEADNLNVIYDDRQSNMYANVASLNIRCSGDMAADNALLQLQGAIKALTFKMDGIPLLSKAHIGANLNIDADFANSKYTLKENTLALNAMQATIDGWAAAPANEPISMDLKLKTSDISFKDILSLIPAIYAKDFEGLKAEGTVSLQAYAKGELTDNTLPQFEATLKVNDGNFRYPALPTSVDNIQIAATASNPGGDVDLTTVNVERFSLKILDNPFAVTAQVRKPISDPDLAVTAKGTLDLGRIKDIYPIEGIALNGILNADMSLGGRLSYIEKELYEQFKANGTLKLQDMKVQVEGIPEVAIQQSTFDFTPRYLNLSETRVLVGDNDITADCRFENYLAFALKGKTLKGQLNLSSQHMNLNDFMSSDDTENKTETKKPETEADEAENKEATGVIIVPENIDFNMNVDMAEILFGNITLRDLNGKLIVKDGTANMSNLSMHTMGGSAVMNGSYSTADSETEPKLKASFALNGLSFAQTFEELDLVRQMAPIFEKLNGNFSGKITVDTELDSTMSPKLEQLTANGNLSTRDLNLAGVELIDKIAEATGHHELKNLSAKDINVDFSIKNGRISTKPFDLKMGNMSLNLSGSTGLDQTIDYTGKLTLPTNTSAISTVGLKINGKFGSPKITIDTQSIVQQATQAATQAITEKAVEAVNQKLGIDISNAQKQKEILVKEAQQAAQKLIDEAEKQKANLVSKAGNNPIKKLAAEKAGDVLIAEAKEQGAKIVAEAEKKGDELIEKAGK